MSIPATKTDRHYTYADYLKFPEDECWEIIDGVAYSMSPAPSSNHQDISGELLAQVHTQLRGKPCKVFAAPFDVRFEDSDKTDKVVQPDLLVVCDRSKITPRGLIGAPDWIVEILSAITAGKDQILKRALYEKRGVREYWLVHPIDRVVTIHRLGAEGRYGVADAALLQGRLPVSAVPGVEIDWDLWQPLEQDAL
ncbi:Uma2 family endonuclease [Panacagrimonas sp.]|uniref:Uma2 family endonuclease n=1 Tax=Panacagrimonas sp. TaxID=2480088 RepID=UPI003B5299CA